MPSTLYHVTKTSSVASIKKDGIRQLHQSVWTTGTGKRYGEGEIFAFEKFADAMKWATHMEWELHKDLGTGKISIVEFIKEGKWEIDTNDPISQSGRKGHWLKKHGPVPAKNIVSDKPVTSAMVKKFIADSNREYGAATNPPRPQIEQKKTKYHTDYSIAEDLFVRASPENLIIAVFYEKLGHSVLGLKKFVQDLYGPDAATKGAMEAYLLIDDKYEVVFKEGIERLLQILRTAIEDVRDSGAYMIYTSGPKNNTSLAEKKVMDLLEAAGFQMTDQKVWSQNEQIWIINFKEQASNPPRIAIAREEISTDEDYRIVKFTQEENLFQDGYNKRHITVEFRWIVNYPNAVPDIFKAFGQSSAMELQDPHQMVARITVSFPTFSSRDVLSALLQAALEEAEDGGAVGVFMTGHPLWHALLKENGFRRTGARNSYGNDVYVKLFNQEGDRT